MRPNSNGRAKGLVFLLAVAVGLLLFSFPVAVHAETVPQGHANPKITSGTYTTITCSPPIIPVNAMTSCTVTVTDTNTGTTSTPTGIVSVTSSTLGNFFGTCILLGSGPSAQCSVGFVPDLGTEGNDTVTATYPGDPLHGGSSGTFVLIITARQTETTLNCVPGTDPVNAPSLCTATVTDTDIGTPVTPTGTVSFTTNAAGVFNSTTCVLSSSGSCQVTYTPDPGSEGIHVLNASYPGDSDHFGSYGIFDLTAIQRSTLTTINCVPGTVPVNVVTTCTVTVTDNDVGTPITPTGTVSLTSSGSGTFSNTQCTLSGGSCQVTYTPSPGSEGLQTLEAYYPGDTDHFPSSGTFQLTVIQRTTTTIVSCVPQTLPVNSETICLATVSDTSPGLSITPTGTVSFVDDPFGVGTFNSTTCMLDLNAQCAVIYTPGPGSEGPITINGTYSGDTDHFPSSGTFQLNATPRQTSTSLVCNPQEDPDNVPTTCTVTVTDTDIGIAITPTGTVGFTSSLAGTFNSTTCTLSGSGSSATCAVTYTPNPGTVGLDGITANYGGDTDHFASSGSFTVQAVYRGTSVKLTCTKPHKVGDEVTCTFTVKDVAPGTPITPTGSVNFTITGPGGSIKLSCTLSGSGRTASCSVSFTPGQQGKYTVTGVYSGDTSHKTKSKSKTFGVKS